MFEKDIHGQNRFELYYWLSLGLTANSHAFSYLILRKENPWKLYITSHTFPKSRHFELSVGLQTVGKFNTHDEVTTAASRLVLAGAIFGDDSSVFTVMPDA